MRKLLISFCLSFVSVLAFAHSRQLDNTMIVPDKKAWNEFVAKLNKIENTRPSVALVLGGGGAKGSAHIGVMKYLEEIGMPVDVIIGTSMGGLMGGLFSMGLSSSQVDSIISNVSWAEMMSDEIPRSYITYVEHNYAKKYQIRIPLYYEQDEWRSISESKKKQKGIESNDTLRSLLGSIPSAYIEGQNVSNMLSSLTVGYQDSTSFAKFPIPFACIATDLTDGKGIVQMSGNINDALRATMSIPFVFSPVRKNGHVLIDGGMRDNFPTDIAKLLGADIIIGVSVEERDKTYNGLHNAADILSAAIDLSAKAILDQNLEIPDVLIEPDLNGLNSLSFSKENIKTLISNGYKAAQSHSEQLLALKDRVKTARKTLNAPAVKPLQYTPVKVKEITFAGLNQAEEKVVRRALPIKPGQTVSKSTLDTCVMSLFGTQSFNFVKYRINGKGPDYNLLFDCQKGPIHQLGIGLRFDSEEIIGAMLNFGYNTHKLYGMKADLDVRVSANPYACISFGYDSPAFPTVKVAVDVRYADTGLLSYGNTPLKMSYFITRQKLFLTDVDWTYASIKGGIFNEWSRVNSYTESYEKNPLVNPACVAESVWRTPNNYFGLFADWNIDNTDKAYFPTRGITASASYKWQFRTNRAGQSFDDFNYHELFGNISAVVPGGRVFAFIPSFSTRMLFSHNRENIPLAARNVLGGAVDGRYFDHQMAFTGFTNVYSARDIVMLLKTDFRFQFLKKQYITAKANYAYTFDMFVTPKDYFGKSFVDGDAIYGAALQYAYESIVGPISLDVMWANTKISAPTKGFGAYLSVGFNF